ncbi:MAG: hypothetical protein J7M29_05450 [Verrucomicrobia bacterium]|nr:hypothetical protein [Verrucomicrobiota bacterium]
MNAKKPVKIALIGTAIFLVVVTCGLGYCRWKIQTTLDECCKIAQAEHPHPGDDVAAMMEFVQSESHSLKDRNLMVWALGQARDSRALQVLESFYTGGKCDHSRCLCQRELEKAIKLCRGETPNILSIKTPKASNAPLPETARKLAPPEPDR